MKKLKKKKAEKKLEEEKEVQRLTREELWKVGFEEPKIETRKEVLDNCEKILRTIGIRGEQAEEKKEVRGVKLSKWNDFRRMAAAHANDNDEALKMGTAEELRVVITGYTQSTMSVGYDDDSEDKSYWN